MMSHMVPTAAAIPQRIQNRTKCGMKLLAINGSVLHARMIPLRAAPYRCPGRPWFPRRSMRRGAVDASTEPEWDAAAMLFGKSGVAPTQQETQQKVEAEDVDIGEVHFSPGFTGQPVCLGRLAVHHEMNGGCLHSASTGRILRHSGAWVLQVLFVGEGMAIVRGSSKDAPVGTMIRFENGGSGCAACSLHG